MIDPQDYFQRAEVRYRKDLKSEWSAGIVTAAYPDGTFDITDYDSPDPLRVRHVLMATPQLYSYMSLRLNGFSVDAGAIVKLWCCRPMSRNQAWDKMREAVTQWVADTDEGAEAWNFSSGDLNVGDLCNYSLEDSMLSASLRFRNIIMKIESLEADGFHEYDEVLVDREKVYRETCRTCGDLFRSGEDGYDGECPSWADKTAENEDRTSEP
ncbi:MAG: hypothetical protein E6R03_05250 [Hyphomicrobiaceae bacterium]|nr:MAG: hypothetical protein E6R03_05250 [Hyphomicrobiaceae bacterium]